MTGLRIMQWVSLAFMIWLTLRMVYLVGEDKGRSKGFRSGYQMGYMDGLVGTDPAAIDREID